MCVCKFSKLFPIYLLALSLLITQNSCGKKKEQKSQEREIRVKIGVVETKTLRRQIPVQGTVTPVDFATISAKIDGTLEKLAVDEGDVLKKGDVLFEIDRTILQNQVSVCENEVKVKLSEVKTAIIAKSIAEITFKKAEIDSKRFNTLFESKATSQAELENYATMYEKAKMDVEAAIAAVSTAEAQLKKAEGSLFIARKNLADSRQIAPFNCVVTDRYIEENEYVSEGTKILKLENPDKLEIVCYISAIYYQDIIPGKTPVTFRRNGKDFGKAVITYKAPSIDPESRTFKLKILVPSSVNVVSGELCNVNIILEEKKCLALPTDALLLRANNRNIVYAVDKDNRAKSIEVHKGLTDGAWTEITDAEKIATEKIVISGQTFVNSGSLLKVMNQ